MGNQEYLVIRGRLDRAGGFTPRRCTSTTHVNAWPQGTSAEDIVCLGAGPGEVVVETVADDGEVLQREVAQVSAEEPGEIGDRQSFRVLAYIGLQPRAAEVRLRREDRVIWEMWVPGAPTVEVRLERLPERGGRTPRPAELGLTFSPQADETLAFVTVVYRWGERGFRTVHVGPVRTSIEIPVDGLPGGTDCRFLVTYSNGLRSASASTGSFTWEPLGPAVTVVRPIGGERVVAGVPLVLEGFAEDPEHPGDSVDAARLVWRIDDKEVAAGAVTSIDLLEPGRHEVSLVYRGRVEARETVAVWVRKPQVPTADQWEAWDPMVHG